MKRQLKVPQIEHKITFAKTQLLSELVTRNNADWSVVVNNDVETEKI